MIGEFRGETRWLSNFFPSKCNWKGLDFPSVENAYQASKSDDPEVWRKFQTITPREAQKLGQTISLRPTWEQEKRTMMGLFVTQKFMNSPELQLKLLSTGDQELVEGNTWGDTYWGVCNGVGENWLGKILMIVRDQLRHEKEEGRRASNNNGAEREG